MSVNRRGFLGGLLASPVAAKMAAVLPVPAVARNIVWETPMPAAVVQRLPGGMVFEIISAGSGYTTEPTVVIPGADQ